MLEYQTLPGEPELLTTDARRPITKDDTEPETLGGRS
jgi:hypothetical protein